MAPRRLSILGIGLLGGSIGLAVKQRLSGCTVTGYGHRPATRQLALKLGAVDEAAASPAAAVRGAQFVLLCSPVGVFEPLLREIAPALEPGAIVTDVGSTKRSVAAAADRLLPAQVHFVGSHPMAGSEKRGVEFATAHLFQDAVCITTPTPRTDAGALEKVEDFWRTLGMRLTRLSPEEHDRRLAEISHLPHALAAALVQLQDEATLPLAGKGFLDATRIAAGDAALWRDIFLDNRDHLAGSLRRYQASLQVLLERLEKGDPQAILDWLDGAARRRRTMT